MVTTKMNSSSFSSFFHHHHHHHMALFLFYILLIRSDGTEAMSSDLSDFASSLQSFLKDRFKEVDRVQDESKHSFSNIRQGMNDLSGLDHQMEGIINQTICGEDQLDNIKLLLSTELEEFQNATLEQLSAVEERILAELNNMQGEIEGFIEAFINETLTPNEEPDPCCEHPAHSIHGLGCVIPVDDDRTWQDAREYCKTLGGRLLEGLFHQSQLDALKEPFAEYFGGWWPWIGIRKHAFAEGKEPIDLESELWTINEPQGNEDCGGACTHCDPPGLFDAPCSDLRRFMCQKICS